MQSISTSTLANFHSLFLAPFALSICFCKLNYLHTLTKCTLRRKMHWIERKEWQLNFYNKQQVLLSPKEIIIFSLQQYSCGYGCNKWNILHSTTFTCYFVSLCPCSRVLDLPIHVCVLLLDVDVSFALSLSLSLSLSLFFFLFIPVRFVSCLLVSSTLSCYSCVLFSTCFLFLSLLPVP